MAASSSRANTPTGGRARAGSTDPRAPTGARRRFVVTPNMYERRIEPRYRVAVDEDLLPDATAAILARLPMIALAEPIRESGLCLRPELRAELQAEFEDVRPETASPTTVS